MKRVSRASSSSETCGKGNSVRFPFRTLSSPKNFVHKLKHRRIQKGHHCLDPHRRYERYEDVRAVQEKAPARIVRKDETLRNELVDQFLGRTVDRVQGRLLEASPIENDMVSDGMQAVGLDFLSRVNRFRANGRLQQEFSLVVPRNDPQVPDASFEVVGPRGLHASDDREVLFGQKVDDMSLFFIVS